MFHHGHSDCVCPDLELPGHPEHQHCQPGCKSSMPTLAELDEQARKDAEPARLERLRRLSTLGALVGAVAIAYFQHRAQAQAGVELF